MQKKEKYRFRLIEKIKQLSPQQRLKFRVILLSLLALGIGLLTPHIFRGHTLIPRYYGESALFLLDFIFLLLVMSFYYRDLKKVEAREQRARTILTDTFKHLGLANRKVEILTQFMNAAKSAGPGSKREVIQELFTQIMVTLLHSPLGVLRVIDKRSARTLTEWRYSRSGIHRQLAFSNKAVLQGSVVSDSLVKYISLHGPRGDEPVCVIGYMTGDEAEISREFVATLLGQIYLLIIACGLIEQARVRRISLPDRHEPQPKTESRS